MKICFSTMVVRVITALCLAFPAFYGSAWADTEEDGRIWFNLNAQGKLPAEGWNWYAEIQPRWRDEGAHLDSVLLRPALFYKLSAKSSIWLGYANVTNHPAGRSASEENRLWQQYTYNFDPFQTFTLQNRTRFEERRLEAGDDTGYRLRQMMRVSKPLASNPAVALVVWDEFFINLNDTDWGAHAGTDQNRLFLGASWAANPTVKLEMGYINQYVNTQQLDRMNHILSTTLGLTF